MSTVPVITEQPEVKKETPTEQPIVSVNETDEYLAKRREEKSKKRGGFQARLDQLTKEKNEAIALAESLRSKAVITEEKKEEPVKVEIKSEVSDIRPKREDFKDEAEFTTKIAEWVVKQQAKILEAGKAAPVTEEKKETPPAVDPKLKAEYDNFLAKGNEFIKTHPDFNEALNNAAARGLTLHNASQLAIVKLAVPEVAYYLANPVNEAVARALMAMDEVKQAAEIVKIAERLAINPADFVSNAGKPGIHLTNGNSRATIPLAEMDTDDYLAQRRADIKSGRRRR